MLIGGFAVLAAIKAIPWATIVRVGALVAIVLGPVGAAAWFGYEFGFSKGADELLEQATECATAIAARDGILEGVREDLEDNAERFRAAEALLVALEARPPAVVIRYRDASPAPAEVIVSPDCESAKVETLDFVRQLAALEGDI